MLSFVFGCSVSLNQIAVYAVLIVCERLEAGNNMESLKRNSLLSNFSIALKLWDIILTEINIFKISSGF